MLPNAPKKKLHIHAIKIGGNQLIAIAAKAHQKFTDLSSWNREENQLIAKGLGF
jgi:hypothetical protein